MNRQDLEDTIEALTVPAAILEAMPDGNFRLAELNEPCRTLFATDADPRGRLTREFVFSATAGERIQALAEHCMNEGTPISSEETFILRDQSVLHVRISLSPFVDEGGSSLLFGTIDNVTELVNLRMERAKELAMAASGFVEMCAWCNSVLTDEGFQPPDEFVKGLSVESSEGVRCPDCQNSRQE